MGMVFRLEWHTPVQLKSEYPHGHRNAIRNENQLFGRHFETVKIFYYISFGCNMVVISVYMWCRKWLSFGEFPWNPPVGRGNLYSEVLNKSDEPEQMDNW